MATYNNVITNVSGSVGIGTTNASSRLTVLGNSALLSEPIATFRANGSQTGGAGILDVQNNAGASILFVSGSGNVGVGVTTLYAKFGVWGDIGAWSTGATSVGSPVGASLYLGDINYYNAGFYNQAPGFSALYDATPGVAGSLGFYSYNGSRAERMRITAAGNVGIGGTNPISRFEITGSNSASTASSFHAINSTGTSLIFVRNDGFVGISTAVPAAGSVKLQVGNASSLAQVTSIIIGGGSDKSPVLSLLNSGNREGYIAQSTTALYIGNSSGLGASYTDSNLASNAHVTISTGGFVGIGSTTPTAKLHVSDTSSGTTAILRNSDSGATLPTRTFLQMLGLYNNGSNGHQLHFHSTAETGVWEFNITKDWGGIVTLGSSTDGTSRVRHLTVKDTGNVGVGTTNPTARLFVSGSTTTTTPTLVVKENQAMANATATLDVQNSAGTSLLFVSGSGNVGIGTNNPANALHVLTGGSAPIIAASTSAASWLALRYFTTTTLGYVGTGNGLVTGGASSDLALRAETGAILFSSVATERMRIDASGNVGIAQVPNVYGDTPRLLVYGGASSTSPTIEVSQNGTGVAYHWQMRNGNGIVGWMGTDNTSFVLGTGTSTERMRIDSSGNVGIGTTNPNGNRLAISGGNLSVTGSVLPGDNGVSYDLGSTTYRWRTLHAVNISGSLTPTGATAGSVFFAGTAGQIAQDNTNFFWDDANNRLGIGTNVPQKALEVITPASDYASVGVRTLNTNEWTGIHFGYRESSTNYRKSAIVFERLDDAARGKIHILNNDGFSAASASLTDARMTISSSGNVGIGGTGPTARLEVTGSTNTSAAATFHAINSAGTSLLYVRNDGPVGIGTGSPTSFFQVSSVAQGNFRLDTGGTGGHYYQAESTPRLGIGRDLPYDSTQTASGYVSFTNGGGTVAATGAALAIIANRTLSLFTSNATALTPRMTIDGSGNIGIGLTNPTARLLVSGSSTASTPTMLVKEGVVSPTAGALAFEVQKSSGATLFAVSGSGNVGIGTSIPNATFEVVGVSGSLFSVTDNLSGSLFSVNTISGLPILEVFSDNTLIAGAYNSNALVVTGSRVGVGTRNPIGPLDVYGTATASPSNTAGIVRFNSTATNALIFGTLINTPFASYIQSGGGNQYPLSLNPLGANVGVGITNPSSKLHVAAGDIRFDSSYGIIGATNTAGYVLRGDNTRFVPAQLQYSDLGGLPTIGNGTLTVGVSGTGLSVSASPTFTANQTGNTTVTITSNATSANTVSTIVARDASGNFSAGTISAIIVSSDTRNVTTTPETLASAGVVFDFKANTSNALSDGGTYHGLMTFRQYGAGTDWSGGRSHQLGFTDNDNVWHRSGTSTTWGTWYKFYHTGNLTNPTTGTGTSGYVARFNGTTTLTNSVIQDDGTRVGVGTTGTSTRMTVYGTGTGTDTTLLVRHQVANGSNLPVLDVQNSSNVSLLFVSGSGNVGINTTTIPARLTVATSTQYDGIFLRNAVPRTVARLIGTASDNDGGALALSFAGNDTVLVSGNGNSYFNSSNVGIGTNNPTQKLHITTATSLDGIYQTDGTRWLRTMAGTVGDNSFNDIVEANDNAIIFSGSPSSPGTGALVIAPWASGTKGLRMDSSGNVGIGTTSMSRKLVVHASDALINGHTVGRGTDSAPSDNVALGSNANATVTSGQYNTAVGFYANRQNNALENTAVGYIAMDGNTASYNTAVGSQALYGVTSGPYNTAIGYKSLYSAGSSNYSVGVGAEAGYAGSSAGRTAVGYQALAAAAAAYTTAVGYRSLNANTTGTGNVGLGALTLEANDTGSNNTALGYNALLKLSKYSRNTAVGSQAMAGSTQGQDNVAVGYNSLYSSVTDVANVAMGSYALQACASSYNVGIGYSSLYSVTTGGFNVGIGPQAGTSITTGNGNVVIGGYGAGGSFATQANNIFLSDGNANLRMIITGSTGFVGIGTTQPNSSISVYNSTTNGTTAVEVQAPPYSGGSTSTAKFSLSIAGVEVGRMQARHGISALAETVVAAVGSGQALAFETNSVRAATIDTSQRVGIGTNNPATKLDVRGLTRIGSYGGTFQGLTLINNDDSSATENISFIDFQNNLGTADSHIFAGHVPGGSSFLAFGTTPAGSRSSDRRAEAMRITGDGKVGIGTLNPTATLSVACGSTEARINQVYTGYAGIFLNGSTTDDHYNILSNASGSDKNLYLNRPTGWDIRFRVNNNDQVTITSAGRVGIGTATPDLGFLHVNGVINNAILVFSYGWLRNATTASGRATPAFGENINSSIYASDRIISNTEVNSLSDCRAKDIERKIRVEEGLDFVEKVNPVIYTWKSSEKKEKKYGFIAQDVLKAGYDSLVGILHDPEIEEYTDEEGFTSPKGGRFVMCYDNVVPLLSAAMKGLKQENDSLKSEIQSLKDQISSILSMLSNK